ncbi:MAG: NUDIX domain-containing protein [Candidatus Pacearchaeota archaeon]
MKRPEIGVSIILMKENKVLMGKRKNSHGNGTWSFPGGHLKMFENLRYCALRELEEETGFRQNRHHYLMDFSPCVLTEDFFEEEKKHYLTHYFRAKHINGAPRVMEPNKCDQWKWYEWNKMPSNLFLPIKNLKSKGYDPFR